MKKHSNVVHLDAHRDREEQLDSLLCDLEAIAHGLDLAVEGITNEGIREFLVRKLQDHLAAMRELMLPEALHG